MITIGFSIPGNPPHVVDFETGKSIVFVGANGAGKTRLGVLIEQNLGNQVEVHRIAAHRSLVMNTRVQPGSYDAAEKTLLYGYEDGASQHRHGHRWQGNPATLLLSDFDHVVRALYADENRTSVLHRQEHLKNPAAQPPETRLDRLNKIWHRLLPHRELVIRDADIKVKPAGSESEYDASQLSDGERVIFYLLGQALLARPNSFLIVDEPELHIHRAILPKLWDAIETARSDCGFIYLTHDLEFASSRHAATKIALRSYENDQWEVQTIPENTGFPEDVVAKILGSRQGILFVEGDLGSLDISTYRRVYEDRTVIPVGACEQVIHSTVSFAQNASLHRLGCKGIIDADNRTPDEIRNLESLGVFSTPVSEIENLFLLPQVFLELAALLNFDQAQAEEKLNHLKGAVFQEAQNNIDSFGVAYVRRQIDGRLKTLGLASKDIASLASEFAQQISTLDLGKMYTEIKTQLGDLISAQRYEAVLALYSNKGLLASASQILGMKNKAALEELIGRSLRSEKGKKLLAALQGNLPRNI